MSESSKRERLFVAQSSRLDKFNPYSVYNPTEALYTSLNYPEIITYKDYLHVFKRQDIANRIVKAPVDGTWKDRPTIWESKDTDTPFEEAIDNVLVSANVYYNFYALDILACLGEFALLYIGFGDNTDPGIPVTTAKEITYVAPINRESVKITKWETDLNSKRFGLPVLYTITTGDDKGRGPRQTRTVDWTRVIHVAENTIDNEVYGTPCLEPVFNRLLGIEKLAGGSPEMYWRGARPGYIAQSTDNTIITTAQRDAMSVAMLNFTNNFNRVLFAEGMTVTAMAPQVVSPKEHMDVQLKLVSTATRIPLRILTGSERGELASSQDERSWLNYLEERRVRVAENKFLRPFIDRLIELRVVPPPSSGEYFIEWEPMSVVSEKESAEIAKLKTDALATYSNSTGASDILPIETFLTKILRFSEEEVELILEQIEGQLLEEDSLRDEEIKTEVQEDEDELDIV